MSESFDKLMDYAALVMADCDMPLLDHLKMTYDHDMEMADKSAYRRGYEDGRRSMDAEHYAVAIRLMHLPLDEDSHGNLSQIAGAIWHNDFGWTQGACKGLRDKLVELMGGVREPPTYDVLGNERHKAIAELRRISIDALCDKYDYVEVYPEFLWAVGQAVGLRHGAGFEDIVSRLTHLLGGDECNFSGAESYMDATSEKSNPAETSDASTDHVTLVTPLTENETCPNDDETCPNPVQSMSITDELDNERRKAIAELRKVCTELDESVWTWIEDVAIAIGAQDGPNDEYESMLPKITCRLIHLLGGDEPTAMEYIQRIVREHDRRCLGMELSGAELSQAGVDAMSRRADQSHGSSPTRLENETGITDELRECVNTATKTHDDTPWHELGDDSEADHTICHITEGELLGIADRMDEQFDRICLQHEAVLQATIDAMVDERDDLFELLKDAATEYQLSQSGWSYGAVVSQTISLERENAELRAKLEEADAAIANWRVRERSFDAAQGKLDAIRDVLGDG